LYKNPFDSLLAPELLLPRFVSSDAILRLEFLGKKQVSHTASLHYYIYEERGIIYGTFLTTNFFLDIVALKRLSASISSYKNKSKIRKSMFKEKMKKLVI
jgi:hypothetical protein